MKKFSEIFTLGVQDWLKGLLVAVLGAVISVIQSSINAEVITFDWHKMATVALAAGLAYLTKQFFTGTPKAVEIDPAKTEVIEVTTPKN